MFLTKQDDILTAILALARRYQEATGDQYVAGVWRTNLERRLLRIQLVTTMQEHLPSQAISVLPGMLPQPGRRRLFVGRSR